MNAVGRILNDAGLAEKLGQVQHAILTRLLSVIEGPENRLPRADAEEVGERKKFDTFLLNSCGPAATDSAVEHTLNICLNSGKLVKDSRFTSNMVQNARLVMNDQGFEGEGYQNFSNVMRQFLLPRYAYLDFDHVVDPRHLIDQECGYPKFITPIMYRYMYDRDDVSRRVVDIYSDECYEAEPEVYENEDPLGAETSFDKDWMNLVENFNILQFLHRISRLAGIGHYGALLLGVDDGKDLDQPIDEPELLAGVRGSIGKKQRQLLYIRPFDEYLSFIHQYETDVMSPRYGLAKFYNLVFLDMTIDAAGASIGTRLNRRVHWSRVVHVADNLHSSLVFGTPRMQPVFNRLLDVRKIMGSSGEMFWKGAFPGYSFEIDPKFIAEDPDFDEDKFKEEIERYSNGLQRYLRLVGVKAVALAPQVSDPKAHIEVQKMAIASHYGIPLKIFEGSSEGRLNSAQDMLMWNRRKAWKFKNFEAPYVFRNFVNRLIAIGCMSPPNKMKYFVECANLAAHTDEDRANLALKWTQAMSQYVTTGIIHLIPPIDYMTMVLGWSPRDAVRVHKKIMAEGGYSKLQKVDPSEAGGGGGDGKTKSNLTKGDKENSNGQGPVKRDSGDKKAEGTAS